MGIFYKNTILILHGWGNGSISWLKIKEILTNYGYKVIIPDLPGFGENQTLISQPWSLDDYVEWVKNFCQKENLSQFFLLGHSFGGRIGIKFSIKYPEKILKLILVSSAGIKPKKTFWKKILLLITKLGNKFSFLPFYNFSQKVFYKFIVKNMDYIKAKEKSEIVKQTFKNIIDEDLSNLLTQISVLTLIIWGDKDKITTLKSGYLFKEKIKNSKMEILKNTGHAPHLECPEKLSEIILNSLTNKNTNEHTLPV